MFVFGTGTHTKNIFFEGADQDDEIVYLLIGTDINKKFSTNVCGSIFKKNTWETIDDIQPDNQKSRSFVEHREKEKIHPKKTFP